MTQTRSHPQFLGGGAGEAKDKFEETAYVTMHSI